MTHRFGLVVVIGMLLLPLLAAQAPDPRLTERSAALREGLVELCDWCKEQDLLRERQRLLELVLVFAPNDRKIREAAGYEAITSKRWQRRKGFRNPLRTNREAVPEFERRLGLVIDEIFLLLDEIPTEGEPDLPLADRRDVVEALLVVLPREPRLLEALGEKKKGSRWYLEESLAARERRAQVRRQAELLFAGSGEPAKVPVPDPENAVDLRWKSARLLPGVEVVGTVSDDEIEEAARIAWASIGWFRLATRREAPPFQDFRIVLLQSVEEANLYLHFDRRVDDASRRFADGLTSFWIPKTATVLIWAPDRGLRKEWVARQTTAMLLLNGFGISTRQGAVYEGLGLYLSHKITGLRSTWYVRQSRYDEKRDDRLAIDDIKNQKSWLKLAKRRSRARAPDFRRLLALEVNQMEVEDLVGAYALAAYLVEGAPDRLAPFLERLGQGMNFEFAVREIWGLDALELGTQVGRWLKESVDG